jgi:hypothetical protein
MVERLFNTKLIAIQTDGGDEYQKMNPSLAQAGITHYVLCPHAHQQNGPAERKHRHIVEVALALLAQASMPLKFWDEAVITVTHLINRTSSKVPDFFTPLERIFKQQLDYSFLNTFGCACWPNLRPYNTHKFVFQSKRCIFIGYSQVHKGYKCLEVSSGQVYISRDVIFDKETFPFTELHANAGARLRAKISLLPEYLLLSSNFEPMGTNTTDQSLEVTQNYVPNNVISGVTCEHIHDIGRNPHGAGRDADLVPNSVPGVEGTTLGSESAEILGETVLGVVHVPQLPPSHSGHASSLPHGSASGNACPLPFASGDAPADREPQESSSEQAPLLQVPDTRCPASRAEPIEIGRCSAPSLDPAMATLSIEQRRPQTRLQDGIRKEKQFTDETVRYGCLATTEESQDLTSALRDKN